MRAAAKEHRMTQRADGGPHSLDRLVGASEKKLIKLYDEAMRYGFNVSYCWRDNENGICQRVVNVNLDANRWTWRFYTPETQIKAVTEALKAAIKLYGNKPSNKP
jgi:hypothetical protein